MSCMRCEGLAVVDTRVLVEAKDANARLMAELLEFCRVKKIDHKTLPALTQVAYSRPNSRIPKELE